MIDSSRLALESLAVFGWVTGEEFSPNRALGAVLKHFGNEYDGGPLAIPLPVESSPDLPLIILPSSDGHREFQIARGRLNIQWVDNEGASIEAGELIATLAGQLATVLDELGLSVTRLAVVTSRRMAKEEPGRFLAQRFCREEVLAGPLNRPEGFELHAHKVFRLADELDVNSWIRLRTAAQVGTKYTAIQVIQDINTLAGDGATEELGKARADVFFGAITNELDAILGAYLPELAIVKEN